MYNRRTASIECDSCGVPNDGYAEPNQYSKLAIGIKPAHQLELQWFWLCSDCGSDYNHDPKQFFTEEFFETEPFCDRCESEPVESWGHVCMDCEDGVI